MAEHENAAISSPGEKPSRHSWVKLKLHLYICGNCGMGRVNEEMGHGFWRTTYHLPTGASVVSSAVPACEQGPRTEEYLNKYRVEIDACEDWRAQKRSAKRKRT